MANLFMMFKPLTGQYHAAVSQTRIRKDFAHCVKWLVDEYSPNSSKAMLVMDHRNAHAMSSLYEPYEPEEMLHLSKRLEIHYHPKHGSWMDMVEIGIINRQCLDSYTSSKEGMEYKASCWCQKRNAQKATIKRQLTTKDARIKLKTLYQVVE